MNRRRPYAVLLTLLLLTAAAGARAQTATLRGFVVDRSDGQALPGVNLVLERPEAPLLGAATDTDGYYQIGRIPPGTYVLRATFIGYASFADTLYLGADDLVTRSIELEPAEQVLGEVVVETEGGAALVTAGLQTVRPVDLARIPTPDVSGDFASYLQTLPGIVALGDRGGQVYIRGGTPTQNLVLMDGMLVYQPFHIIGFFSAFPEDLVAQADVYAGGFGARYSARISSAIDVSMRNGNKQRFAGAVSAAPFLTSVRLEGPISPGQVSVIGSWRESVIEHVAPAFLDDPLPFHFSDQYAKLHAEIGENGQLSITGLRTQDRGTIDPEAPGPAGEDAVRWENTVVGARYLALPRRIPVLMELILSTSFFENSFGPLERPERRSSARRINTEGHMTYFLGPTRVRWGAFARTLLLEYELGGLFQDYRVDELSIVEAGLYLEADVELGEGLLFNPGVSVISFPSTFNTSVEPRLRASWRPGGAEGRHQLSAAWGLYRQGITGVTDERDAGSVFVAWLPTPFGEPNSGAMHAILGWQAQVTPALRLVTEGFYKRLRTLAVPAWSALAQFTTTLEQANGHAYGLDARAEVQTPRFYGYVGYGLSTVAYEAAQDNFGVWYGEPVQRYHPPHDRRHQVNAVASLDLSGVDVSVRWQFGSGLPYTRPLGFDNFVAMQGLTDVRRAPGVFRLIYDRPYTGRLPTYHRLDVSAERRFRFRQGAATVQAGVINAYDRANLFYFDLYTVRRVDQLPLVPYVGLKVEVL